MCCAPQVTTDKKSLAYVDNMLKKSNKKVEELHQELQELNAHIVVKDPEEPLGNENRPWRTLTQQLTNHARSDRPALYRIFPSVAKDGTMPSALIFSKVCSSVLIFHMDVWSPGGLSRLGADSIISPPQKSFGNSSVLF